ncbi:hypothetical protein T439DRAFT_303745 [Meredithblackwellia eburnea MCA 4105]
MGGFSPTRKSYESKRSSLASTEDDEDANELDNLMGRSSSDSSRSSSRFALPTHRERPESQSYQQGNNYQQWFKKLPSRYLNLWRSGASFLVFLYSFVALFTLYWAVKFFILRHNAYSHSVFSPPLIPNPRTVEHTVEPVDLPGNAPLPALQSQLDSRLASLGLPASTLECSWTSTHEHKYAPLKNQGPTLFAVNLWNNQVVFPTLARSLLTVADFLGRDNVAISIFENGSTDNTTAAMAHFAAVLSKAGVEHTIVSDPRGTDWKRVDRIAQLSVYRNLALAPLNSTSETVAKPYETVVFVNDVFMCPKDALELLYQKHHQQADAACAMDWRATHSWFEFLGYKSVKYYDNWVGRSITGDMLRSRFDVVAETRDGIRELFDQPGSEFSRARWLAAQPVPVYSCWNGMVAMTAGPFRGDDGPAISFRSALMSPNECSASECKTVARDFWVQGLRRWMIVPAVHVTYAQDVYHHPALEAHKPDLRKTATSPGEMIDWSALSPPKSVVCYEWARGFHLDLPWRRTRKPPTRRR